MNTNPIHGNEGGSSSMNGDIDAEIQKKEAELSPIRQCMEELKIQFIKQTVAFASEWYKNTAKQYVTKYPEVTLGMREEKLAQMKTQVNQLVRDAEKTVRAELENSALWWHQKPRANESVALYLQVGDKHPEILDRAVRHVLGRLGLILEEYKFNVTASGNTGSYQEFWFDHPHGADLTSNPYYPHLLRWSEKMQDTVRDYNTQYAKAIALYTEIQKLKEEKKKQQASTRWDSI